LAAEQRRTVLDQVRVQLTWIITHRSKAALQDKFTSA
jgi:hypothetical protein